MDLIWQVVEDYFFSTKSSTQLSPHKHAIRGGSVGNDWMYPYHSDDAPIKVS
jgi:hypothetical protein